MRLLLALIGYVSCATVVAAALGVGFLWQTDRLNDEKVFRVVALIHDVDIDGVASESEEDEAEIPSEEPSRVEIKHLREIALRNLEAKENALSSGQDEFKHLRGQLTEARERIDGMARELEDRIRRESELASQESVTSVVRDLRSVKPEVAKSLLLKRLNDAGADPDEKAKAMSDVIRLMTALPTNTLTNILKRFATPDELKQLHEIHSLLLDGGPQKAVYDGALRQLQNRDFSE